jgi:hypothetical protein
MQQVYRSKNAILVIVWSLSALYVFGFVDRGWIPHDEGFLAQSAERVLLGELPHRDFDEVYTGGLSYLYAAAFNLLGVNLMSIRYVVFAFFLGFVPALYAIALRFVSPLLAGAVTLLGVVWSVPNYFAGIPSWYNLFFATFGAVALVRHVEAPHWKWLIVCGLCGGLSLLAKVSGIFYIMAAFLFLVYREQVLTRTTPLDRSTRSTAFFVLEIFVGLIFIGSLVVIIRPQLGSAEFVNLLLPSLSIWAFLIWSEWKVRSGPLIGRLKRLLELLLPFGLGVLIPVAAFLVPYLLSDSIAYFINGVFVLPQKRFENASIRFPTAWSLVTAIPFAMLLLSPFGSNGARRLDRLLAASLMLALGVVLSLANHVPVYALIWYSARSLYVVGILAACLVLFRTFQRDGVSVRSQLLLLLAVMAALVSWVQVPFADAIYFCYAAPLGLLTLGAVVSLLHPTPHLLHLGVFCFYFLFAVIWNNTGYVWYLGEGYLAYRPNKVLGLSRGGGIRVTDEENILYTQVVELIKKKHGTSQYIYAAPDCPEVYFLSGLRNPSRKFFDFFGESENDRATISELLDKKEINVVVINQKPHFSGQLDTDMIELLKTRFPYAQDLEKFTVRWKE